LGVIDELESFVTRKRTALFAKAGLMRASATDSVAMVSSSWPGRIIFDAAMAAATAGEPHDLRTLGDLFCSLMLAAEVTLEADRFEQWNRMLFGYMKRNNHPGVLTCCGTCCAEVLGAAGQGTRARSG